MRVIGAGGGKDGGAQQAQQAVEAPDSLHSEATARVLDMVCEGEIEGWADSANPLQCVYVDETPLQNPDGTMNFEGMTANNIVLAKGTPSQDYIPGFAEASSEIAVGVEIRRDSPVVRQVINLDADAIKVRISTPALQAQDKSNGNINPTAVDFNIEVQPNGGTYTSIFTSGSARFEGKSASKYERTFYAKLSGAGPWNVRVTRISPDAPDQSIQNKLNFESYTEIVEGKFRYPNTALVGVQLNAKQFSAIPQRAYRLKLLRIRVPSNYDPLTRNYTGTWDGSFKLAWSNNPAWCFYDLLTSSRYGLGDLIPENQVDKWSLYQIGQYCDAVDANGNYVGVDDGFGGKEPRFTLNLLIQNREQAFKVLNDLASTFRGMTYNFGGTVWSVADAPKDPVMAFSPANVVDGVFSYTGSARRARHNVALVRWNDPDNFYKQSVEYVADEAAIAQQGIQQTEVVAFGCTSRGQAHRVGKWLIDSEQTQTDVVSFKTGMDASYVVPGDIVEIFDPNRAGRRMGGRLLSATATSVQLDAPVTLEAGISYTVVVHLPNGSRQERAISNAAGTTDTLIVNLAFDQVPQAMSVWGLKASNLAPQLARVLSLSDEGDGTYGVSALLHDANKYTRVETGIVLEASPISQLPDASKVPQPENLSLQTLFVASQSITGLAIDVSWSVPSTSAGAQVARFAVQYRRSQDNWTYLPEMDARAVRIDNVVPGDYEVQVRAISLLGIRSLPAIASIAVEDPNPIQYVKITGLEIKDQGEDTEFKGRDVNLAWRVNSPNASEFGNEAADVGFTAPYFKDYEVRTLDAQGTVRRVEYVNTAEYTYSFDKNQQDGTLRDLTFEVAARDTLHRIGPAARIVVHNPPPALPGAITVKANFRTLFLNYALPAETDFAGVLIYVGTTSGFIRDASTLVYDGPDTQPTITALADGTPLQSGTDYYLRLASYDSFGKVGLNESPEFKVTTVKADANDIGNAVLSESHLTTALNTRLNKIESNETAVVEQSTQIDGLSAQYTLKVDANGYLAGFGLAVYPKNDTTTTSEFLIRADTFGVIMPSYPSLKPFTIGTVNGAPSVIMTSAIIGDATIGSAAISDLTADKIRTGSITSQTITLNDDGVLRSGQTAYNTGDGFWFGKVGAVTKFSLGNSLGHHLRWDGSELVINGKLSAGMVTADTLAVGRGSNLVYNPAFDTGLEGWTLNANGMANIAWGRNYGAEWIVGNGVAWLRQGDTVATGWAQIYTTAIPVIAGQPYIASMYSGAHRCSVSVLIYWYDVNGAEISSVEGNTNAAAKAGGKQLSGYFRHYLKATAPANAATCRVVARKYATSDASTGDSFMFVTRVMLEEAAVNQTEASPYSQSGTTLIDGGNIVTGAIQSTNYAAGSAGWRIGLDGSAEFSNVTIRGTVSGGSLETPWVTGSAGYDTKTSMNGATGALTVTRAPSGGTATDLFNMGPVMYAGATLDGTGAATVALTSVFRVGYHAVLAVQVRPAGGTALVPITSFSVTQPVWSSSSASVVINDSAHPNGDVQVIYCQVDMDRVTRIA